MSGNVGGGIKARRGGDAKCARYCVYILRNVYKYPCDIAKMYAKPRNLYFTKRYATHDKGWRENCKSSAISFPSPDRVAPAIAAIYYETRRNLCTDCARSPRARMKIPADCNQASLPTSVLDTESTRHHRSKGFIRALDSSGLRKRSISTLRNLSLCKASLSI